MQREKTQPLCVVDMHVCLCIEGPCRELRGEKDRHSLFMTEQESCELENN